MFHFLFAFSSGEYITSLTGLAMSKGDMCSSTVNGYHFLSCDRASEPETASNAPATSAVETTAELIIVSSAAGLALCHNAFDFGNFCRFPPRHHYLPDLLGCQSGSDPSPRVGPRLVARGRLDTSLPKVSQAYRNSQPWAGG